MRSPCAAALVALLSAAGCTADQTRAVRDDAGRAGYSLGYQVGMDLERQGREIDADALVRGVRDGLEGAEPALSQDEMNALLRGLKSAIETTRRQDRRQRAEQHREEGAAFLAANAEKEGVVALPSGLQYEVVREGAGKNPGPGNKVQLYYRATLIDGTLFHDSRRSGKEPETLHVSGVIRGLTEALQLMSEGARWRLFIPADLASGRRGPVADRTVIYDVELISIVPQE